MCAGLAAVAKSLDHLAGVLVFPLQGDIGLRNHSDEAIVLGGHGQT